MENRNPVVDELVLTEDDRLALLESRLERMHQRVTDEIRSIDQFLEGHQQHFDNMKAAEEDFDGENPRERQENHA